MCSPTKVDIVLIRKMLDLGAHPHAKSRSGLSPRDLALRNANAELLTLFESFETGSAPDLSYKAPERSETLARLQPGYDWKAVYSQLWDELVPPSGRSDSLQGELIRCIGRLSDEAFRNGNINWDHRPDDFREMADFLKQHLLDGTLADDRRPALSTALAALKHHRQIPVEGPDSAHYAVSGGGRRLVLRASRANTTKRVSSPRLHPVGPRARPGNID